MATVIQFFRYGRPTRSGLEVAVEWTAASTLCRYRTDISGSIFIDDDRIGDREHTIYMIYLQNPDGGNMLKFPAYVITRGQQHQLDLEQASRQ